MMPTVGRELTNPAPGDLVIECHAREVDHLEEPFALIVRDGTFIVAVRRGLLRNTDVCLLDRLLKRGLAELLTSTDLALTS